MTGQSGVIFSENLIYNIMENRDFFLWEFFSFLSSLKLKLQTLVVPMKVVL